MYSIEDFDINEIGVNSSISCKVTGYWSKRSICIHIRREINYDVPIFPFCKPEWKVDMVHASGGRDTSEVENDIEAERNFGHALIAMSELAHTLMQAENVEKFEKRHQELFG